ncbi:hypothetical protein [Gilvimarinus sp. 1_MG-2023]|uniref:hypothetical protein n=1 Tax=Gilvimarinus sp. 1_MG-2023 TaxID=3062638 RepID=UPI0026E3EC66|nr:hypothetical protein [Gilvimarinus sp. 1_MG-2023]MDO6746081.1 hypothetical protein [Gilvimarinus sp. 1_MG-2023]
MTLDNDIEEDVLEYLHLEYGECPEDDDALKLSDLNYEGIFLLEGVPTHYWSYPTSEPCWAIVQPYEDAYCFGMATTPPEGLERV